MQPAMQPAMQTGMQPPVQAGTRWLAVIGLAIGFVLGALLGLVLGPVVFLISAWRAARAVHAEGVVCRAELIARDPAAERLAGPAVVRLSGALDPQATPGSDVLGMLIRMPPDGSARSDQDLLLGSFRSFVTAARDRAATDAGDYLANRYSTVTPWCVPGRGPVILALVPPPAAPRERGSDRLARLTADLAADRARFALAVRARGSDDVIGELRLVERLPVDDRALRASMLHQGRGIRPLGIRNGIRATVYPLSQIARRLRGG